MSPAGPGQPTPWVVDIGAGYGMFSLAAAARGLQALAFEASPKSTQALQASIAANGFRIRLGKLALGQRRQLACGDPLPAEGGQAAAAAEQEAVRRGYGSAAAHAREGCKQLVRREPAAEAVRAALPAGGSLS